MPEGKPFLTNPTRWLILLLLFPLACLNGWLAVQVLQYFQPLVSSLLASVLLAFLLNYPVRVLQERGMKREWATGLVFLIAATIVVIVGVILVPMLLQDVGQVLQALPDWIDSGKQQLQNLQRWFNAERIPISVKEALGQINQEAATRLDNLADRVLAATLVTLESFSEVLLVLLFSFYLLLDGDRIVSFITRRLPDGLGDKIRRSLQRNFQNYLISQGIVALLTGSLMTTAFLVLRIDFALLFGISTGLMALIPFGDVLILTIVGVLNAIQSVWTGTKVIAVMVLIDQFIDQILAPQLVGRFIGLKPIGVIISLIVGARIGGVLGLVTAVPLVSFIRDAVNGFPDPYTDSLDEDSLDEDSLPPAEVEPPIGLESSPDANV